MSLSITKDEMEVRARKEELVAILADLLDGDWVVRGGTRGFDTLVVDLAGPVFERTALGLAGRDYDVVRVTVNDDDGSLRATLRFNDLGGDR